MILHRPNLENATSAGHYDSGVQKIGGFFKYLYMNNRIKDDFDSK